MLSNQVLLKSISDMKGITGAEVSVWNLDGVCLFATDEDSRALKIELEHYLYMEEMNWDEVYEFQENEIDYYIRMVSDEETPCYILLFESLQGDANVITALCANQLEQLLIAYKEKLSKGSFLQNLLKGNILEEDIIQKSERVYIKNQGDRIVFLVEPTKKKDEIIAQTLKNLYATGITDFVVEVEESSVVLIKELCSTDTDKEIHHIAEIIVDTLNMEAMVSVLVGYGTVARNLSDVERSYREAKIAIEVGRSFDSNKRVLSYRQLGIGRLIHQLSDELCVEFLLEILGEGGLEQFDDDTMQAAYKFFENDLNISQTARELYVHRNTLSYRLEKIQTKIGLDIRAFEDAITFKLAIMVSNHMEFIKAKKDKSSR